MTHAEEMLQEYINAEKAVLRGQAYMIVTSAGTRQLQRAQLGEIRRGQEYWRRVVNAEKARRQGGGDHSIAVFD